MDKVKIIAVTGGIGSGKSSVLKILKELGFFTLSCDDEVKILYSNRAFLKKLKAIFPTAVSGRFKLTANRAEISKIAFNQPDKLALLNALTHRHVLDSAFNKAKKSKKPIAFIETPVLFEHGYQTLFDGVIVVLRNLDSRINSAMARSNLTREQVLQRINNQVDYDNFDLGKAIKIYNDGDLDNLKQAVINATESLI